MSVSKVQKKLEDTNGLDLMWMTRALYAEILFCFRECHDLCVSSELFTKDTILQIDQCAVDFRQLSIVTVSVAKRVSNQWLDTAIAFFKNVDGVDDPREMLTFLGGQARELARCFKIIAAWARDLGGRFHEAQDGTIKEAEEFKQAFEAAVKRTEEVKNQIAELHANAAKRREEAQEHEDTWKTARVRVAWNPVGLALTSIGASIAEARTEEARAIEAEAEEKVRASNTELSSKKSQNEKAKFIAGKAITLVNILGTLEETCELIAAFWTEEADNFDCQGASMATNEVKMIKSMKSVVVEKNIEFWTAAKERMEKYITAMSVVNNCFNFITETKPPKEEKLNLPNLEITLSIPETVNLQAIEM